MTVRDDLIAAKALIDTPEKWQEVNGIVVAVSLAVYGTKNRAAVIRALRGARVPFGNVSHADRMALFNRAIAATS